MTRARIRQQDVVPVAELSDLLSAQRTIAAQFPTRCSNHLDVVSWAHRQDECPQPAFGGRSALCSSADAKHSRNGENGYHDCTYPGRRERCIRRNRFGVTDVFIIIVDLEAIFVSLCSTLIPFVHSIEPAHGEHPRPLSQRSVTLGLPILTGSFRRSATEAISRSAGSQSERAKGRFRFCSATTI